MVDSASLYTTSSNRGRRQRIQDALFRGATRFFALVVLSLLGAVMVALLIGAMPAFHRFGIAFLWTQAWNPVKDLFGGAPAIFGTLVTSFIAVLIGVPVALGVAIFLTELCPPFLRRPIGVLI